VQVLPWWAVGRGGGVSVLAGALVLGITTVLAKGMKEASWFINGSMLVYGGVVAVIIVAGLFEVDVDNYTPFLPYGATGVIAGASAVFFSFIGFDEVATVAEEARNAATSVPLAMMLSLGIVAVVYVAATLVLVGMVNYADVDIEAPFGAAFNALNRPVIAKLVGLGTAVGMVNTTLVSLAAQPRIFVSMGRDGLLPRFIASTTRETTIRCGVVVSLFALAVPTELLADVVSGGTLIAFLATNMALMTNRVRLHAGQSVRWVVVLAAGCFVCGAAYRLATMRLVPMWVAAALVGPAAGLPAAAVFRLDMRGGAAFEERPPVFLCALVPALPIAGVVTTTFLLTQLPGMALGALAGWLAVSSAIYLLYGVQNSRADGALLRGGEPVSSPASYDGTDSAGSGGDVVDGEVF
jgi:basic amino acid/polyamine antiporter, APA family